MEIAYNFDDLVYYKRSIIICFFILLLTNSNFPLFSFIHQTILFADVVIIH